MKKMRKILAGALACSMLFSTAIAATSANAADNLANAAEEQAASDMVCRSVYYRGGTIDVSQLGTTCYISPTTKSFIACHIYHDITVYKNGQWVTSKRFEDWNSISLTSSVTVSVSTGDVLDIYVDHYAEHESASSSTQYIAK